MQGRLLYSYHEALMRNIHKGDVKKMKRFIELEEGITRYMFILVEAYRRIENDNAKAFKDKISK